MSTIFNRLKNGLAGLFSFLNPGYEISITASALNEAAFTHVRTIIKDAGFIFVADKDSPNSVISEYTRKKKYLISVTLIRSKLSYTARSLDLSIKIGNEYKGSQPALKEEINELAHTFYKELSKFAGKDKLKISRHRTAIPL